MSAYALIGQTDEGYDANVSHKFTGDVANLFTGLGEVPKTIVDASGRTATAIFDILSRPHSDRNPDIQSE